VLLLLLSLLLPSLVTPLSVYSSGLGRLWRHAECNISETGQDRTKVTIDDQLEMADVLSIGAKINDLGCP